MERGSPDQLQLEWICLGYSLLQSCCCRSLFVHVEGMGGSRTGWGWGDGLLRS